MTLIPYGEIDAASRAFGPRRAEHGCRIVEALVSAVFGVSVADIGAGTRGRAPVAFARQAAMYLAHVHLGLGARAVGAYFGRDRSTVAHACARVEDCRDKPRWSRIFDQLEIALDAWDGEVPAGDRTR